MFRTPRVPSDGWSRPSTAGTRRQRPAVVRAAGVAPAAVAAVAGAGAERSGRAGADDAGRRAAEPGVVPPASAPRGRAGDRASQLGGPPRQLLRHRPHRLPRGAAERRRCAASLVAPRARGAGASTNSEHASHDGGCCSCAPGTALGPRSPRRCSSACRPGRSRPPAPAAIRSHCIPNAVRVLRTSGSTSARTAPSTSTSSAPQRFDTVITLCDRVREVCPEFPSRPELVHWSVPDPALEGPTDRASYPAFERTAAELETRIGFRLPLLDTHRNRQEVHECPTMRSSTSATWSTTSRSRSPSTPNCSASRS